MTDLEEKRFYQLVQERDKAEQQRDLFRSLFIIAIVAVILAFALR